MIDLDKYIFSLGIFDGWRSAKNIISHCIFVVTLFGEWGSMTVLITNGLYKDKLAYVYRLKPCISNTTMFQALRTGSMESINHKSMA